MLEAGARKRPRPDEALQGVALYLGPDDQARIEAVIPPDALHARRFAFDVGGIIMTGVAESE